MLLWKSQSKSLITVESSSSEWNHIVAWWSKLLKILLNPWSPHSLSDRGGPCNYLKFCKKFNFSWSYRKKEFYKASLRSIENLKPIWLAAEIGMRGIEVEIIDVDIEAWALICSYNVTTVSFPGIGERIIRWVKITLKVLLNLRFWVLPKCFSKIRLFD